MDDKLQAIFFFQVKDVFNAKLFNKSCTKIFHNSVYGQSSDFKKYMLNLSTCIHYFILLCKITKIAPFG